MNDHTKEDLIKSNYKSNVFLKLRTGIDHQLMEKTNSFCEN